MRPVRALLIALCALVILTPSVPAVGPLRFYSITPCRVIDTRNVSAPRLVHGTRRHFQIRGLCGVPSGGPVAVALNATIIQPDAAGHLTLWPYNPDPASPVPNVSSINYSAGEFATANGALASLNPTDPGLQLSAIVYLSDPMGGAQLVIDVVGYFQ
jgi:hypothetical protein